jgi:hypothetical protein
MWGGVREDGDGPGDRVGNGGGGAAVGAGVAGEAEAERGGRRGGRVGGPGLDPADAGGDRGERPSAPSFLTGGGGRCAVDRPVVSRRHGFGGAAGSSDAGSGTDRGGLVGPVREAGDDEVAGLAAPLAVLGCRLGGGAKLDGSRREERGAAAWVSRRVCVCVNKVNGVG